MQGKVQKFRPYIDSCAVGGLQSKRTQTKKYPSQNVPSWRQNLLKWGQNLPKWSQNVPSV